MLTVVCLYVKGPYPYTAEYVVRLERMVRRHLRRPFRFVCLVDRDTLPEVLEAYLNAPDVRGGQGLLQIENWRDVLPAPVSGYWHKVKLFDPAIGMKGRVLYLDLDTLIVSDLDPIVDFPAALALTTDAFVDERAHLDRDRYGRQLVRRFNSSVMVFEGGAHAELFNRWTPEVAARLSGDQDWIGEQARDAQGMRLDWFPRISQLTRDPGFAATGAPMPPEAKVILMKKPKQHEGVQRWPWLDAMWGAA